METNQSPRTVQRYRFENRKLVSSTNELFTALDNQTKLFGSLRSIRIFQTLLFSTYLLFFQTLNLNEHTESTKPQILLIDDNQDVLTVIKLSLEMLGYAVAEFENGRDAIEQFPTIKPSLAIIDQGLPDIRGLEVGRRFREMDTENPCILILLTGTDGQALRDEATAAGFIDFLVKPVRIDALSECINRHLNVQ